MRRPDLPATVRTSRFACATCTADPPRPASAGAPTTPVRSPYPDGVDSTSSALPPLPTAPTAALALATGVPLARLIAECFSAHYQRSLLGGACPTAEELDAVKMLAGHCLRS